ncbi:MAG: TyrR/PhhR family helix-turn-helix DNA-binding protein [Bacillota bacterium]
MVIQAVDRVGITLDVLRIIYRFQLNIVSMDVSPELIHLKLASLAPDLYSQLVDQLMLVPGVRRVEEVETLPSEQRQQQLAAILNAVSEGIIAVDAHGVITLLNPAAELVLMSSASQTLCRPISEVLSPVERGINLAGGAVILEPVHLALTMVEMYSGGCPPGGLSGQPGPVVQTPPAVPAEAGVRTALDDAPGFQAVGPWAFPPAHPAAPIDMPPGSEHATGPKGTSTGVTLADAVARTEEMLVAALHKYRSARRAAKALGLSHTAVLQKMRKHGLTRKD